METEPLAPATPAKAPVGSTRTLQHRLFAVIPHIVAMLALVALPIFASWTLLTPKATDRASIAPGDFSYVYYPFHFAAVQAWQHGHPLLWTPAIDAGQPAFADTQFDVFYPFTMILGLALGPHRTFTPDMLIRLDLVHQFIAELGAYLLLLWLLGNRRADLMAPPVMTDGDSRPRSPVPAALLGAIIFGFSGYLTTYPVQDVNILQASVWLPWVVLALDLALVRQSWRRAMFVWVPLALVILAGHPQVLLYVAYAHVLYTVTLAASVLPKWQWSLQRLMLGGVSLIGGLLLGAIQLLPTFELAPQTVRGNLNFEFLAGGYLPHELIGLIIPKGFDGATPLYLGAAALVIAVVGLRAGPRDVRLFGALLAVISLPLALGKYAALYPLAYLAFPGFAQVRDQERAIFLLTFAIALLAANGLHQLLCRTEASVVQFARQLIFPLSAAVAAGGAMSLMLATQLHWGLAKDVTDTIGQAREGLDWTLLIAAVTLATLLIVATIQRPAPWLAWAVVAYTALDLLSAHPGYETVAGVTQLYPTNALIAHMQADQQQPFRVSSEGLLPAGGNAGLLFGLEDIVGNSPLELTSFHQLASLPEPQRWALLNVRYMLTKRATLGPNYALVSQLNDVRLFQTQDTVYVARAWLVHQTMTVAADNVMPAVAKIDVRQTAVVQTATTVAPALGVEHVAITAADADHFTIVADASSPALLVISQIAYPGWQATVDGQPASLESVDGAIFGLPLAAGTHNVTLAFQPKSLRAGTTISVLAALLVVGALLFAPAQRLFANTMGKAGVQPIGKLS